MHNSHYHTSPQDNTHKSQLEFIIAHYNSHTCIHMADEKNDGIGAAQPISVEAAKAIVKHIDKGEVNRENIDFEGLIPTNVVRYRTEERFIIWQTPPQLKYLIFSDKLSIESGVYPIPPLLWKLVGTSLKVFALKEPLQSVEDTVYQAPFLNVDENGSVCMGNAEIDNHLDTYEEVLEQADRAFFNSVFTHTNCDLLANRNISDILAEQAEKKLKTFDTELLVETNQSINSIL